MDVDNNLWDELNDEYHIRREALLRKLKELDAWYEEQFVLLGITSSERRKRAV